MAAWFPVIFTVFAVATATTPAPPAATALHEITRASSLDALCTPVVVHANAAIAATLHDDAALARMMSVLRQADLEASAPSRRGNLNELARLSADVTAHADRGADETRRLRTFADGANAARTAAINAFASDLGEALEQQRHIAADLVAFLDYIDLRDMREPATTAEGADKPDQFDASNPGPVRHDKFTTNAPFPGTTETGMAHAAAGDFAGRLVKVAGDETRAADQTDAAISGC